MEHYQITHRCRICGSEQLTEVIWLDEQYLSPTFVKTNEGNALVNIKAPMTLLLCDRKKNSQGCGLLQLKEAVNKDLLYTNYFYRSATSTTMREDLKDVVRDVERHVSLEKGDSVLDIGANDGTMLAYFPAHTRRIGIEPAKNIDWSTLDPSLKMVNDYFSKKALETVAPGEKVKAITACAMFYDLEDPNGFVADVKSILAPNGVWCIQLSYLPLMLQNMNFYDICNEHLEYYSLHTLQSLMKRHHLTIVDATTNAVNGGSVRVFITHDEGSPTPSSSFLKLYNEEERLALYDVDTYSQFFAQMTNLRDTVRNHILREQKRGHLVLGLGASTKGNVLLQFFGITKEMLPAISERNPDKVGLRTLGTDIELISEEDARQRKPSCMLVLPWYFKEEIVKREQEYIQRGGTLLFPMPSPHLVTNEGEQMLSAARVGASAGRQ